MLSVHRTRGVTLIELMAVLAILSILMLLGIPYYKQVAENSQTRNAAESIQNGLRMARAEAVRRNTRVRLHLTSQAGLADWIACLPDPGGSPNACQPPLPGQAPSPEAVSWWAAKDGAPDVRIAVAGLGATDVSTPLATTPPGNVAFDGLGRALGNTFRIDIKHTNAQGNAVGRRLVIQISTAGQVRMCDPSPALAVDDLQRCL
jgi:type IV fimbrial biogenesis protein FimT